MKTTKQKKFYQNFEKELEKQKDRFEFKDVNTLETLVTESNSIMANIKGSYKDFKEASKIRENFKESIKNLERRKDETLKESVKILKKIEDLSKMKTNNEKEAHNNLELVKEGFLKADKSYSKAEQDLNLYNSYGEKHIDEMQKNLSMFISKAKSLGVDVSNKVSKYKDTISRIKSVL